MKKILLPILSFLLLFSCGETISTSTSSESTSSESSSLDNEEKWTKETYDVIQEVMNPEFIPYINADMVSAMVSTDEQSNLPYVSITLAGGFNSSSIEDEYEALLTENGFTIVGNNGYPYGYKEYSLTQDGVIQYEVSQTGVFSLVCYVITSRMTEWPEYYIQNICDTSIPKYETKTYEYSIAYDKTNSHGYYLTMNCNKAGSNSIETYSTLLIKDGYNITNKNDIYYAENNEKEVEILFYYNDVSDDLFLKVMSTSSWPVSDINFFLGEGLPRYLDVPLSEYTYMTPSNKELLVLYFDNAEQDAKDQYKASLLKNGWETDKEDDYFLYKVINGVERGVQLSYGFIENLNIYSFVIAIY